MKNILLILLGAALLPAFATAKPKKAGKGFDRLDTNGDGVVTIEEAEEANAEKFVEYFDQIDTDGNGEVTKTELREHHKQRMEERRAQREAMDADGNGAISYDEAADAGAEKLVDNFDRIDADGDGEITREEMREAGRAIGNRKRKGQREKEEV